MRRRTLALILVLGTVSLGRADQVIMKDGAVFKGKILKENSKLILIGNPPFDPKEHLLRTEDVEKIIYEEYKPLPPAERRFGFMLETQLIANFFSSPDLPLHPGAEFMIGGGIRVHPLLEIDGGLGWQPEASASNGGLSVSNTSTTRGYSSFGWTDRFIMGRVYPFYWKKSWKIEPYAMGGWAFTHLSGKGTDDTLMGDGWLVGVGAMRPVTNHWYVDGRVLVRHAHLDTIDFLNQEGGLQPAIDETITSVSLGLSYRF